MLENQRYSIVYQMQKRKVPTFLLLNEPNIGVVNVWSRIEKLEELVKPERVQMATVIS
jgi:hypothetical protein